MYSAWLTETFRSASPCHRSTRTEISSRRNPHGALKTMSSLAGPAHPWQYPSRISVNATLQPAESPAPSVAAPVPLAASYHGRRLFLTAPSMRRTLATLGHTHTAHAFAIYASTTTLPQSLQDSLLACRAQLWPGGFRTHWMTNDISERFTSFFPYRPALPGRTGCVVRRRPACFASPSSAIIGHSDRPKQSRMCVHEGIVPESPGRLDRSDQSFS